MDGFNLRLSENIKDTSKRNFFISSKQVILFMVTKLYLIQLTIRKII